MDLDSPISRTGFCYSYANHLLFKDWNLIFSYILHPSDITFSFILPRNSKWIWLHWLWVRKSRFESLQRLGSSPGGDGQQAVAEAARGPDEASEWVGSYPVIRACKTLYPNSAWQQELLDRSMQPAMGCYEEMRGSSSFIVTKWRSEWRPEGWIFFWPGIY